VTSSISKTLGPTLFSSARVKLKKLESKLQDVLTELQEVFEKFTADAKARGARFPAAEKKTILGFASPQVISTRTDGQVLVLH